MPTNIKVPDSAWHRQDVTVNGTLLRFIFKYNTTDESWYIDLRTASDVDIITGVKVMPNQSLTQRYSYRDGLPSGNLWCVRRKNDYSPVTRDNFGVGKNYELWWLTEAEEKRANINETVQL